MAKKPKRWSRGGGGDRIVPAGGGGSGLIKPIDKINKTKLPGQKTFYYSVPLKLFRGLNKIGKTCYYSVPT